MAAAEAAVAVEAATTAAEEAAYNIALCRWGRESLTTLPPVVRPRTKRSAAVKPPRVDPVEVVRHVYRLLLEIGGRESAATEMLG